MNSKHTLRKLLTLVAVCIAAILLVGKYNTSEGQQAKPNTASQKVVGDLEIPIATVHRNEQIIRHAGYTVSFNPDWHIPNWVAYKLTAEETSGVTQRGKSFLPDPLVTKGSATTNDYKNSGWDRGHMAPAADMKWSQQAMNESFYLSNICPQNHNLNAGDWRILEEKVRDLANHFKNVYIVCGPIVGKESLRIGANRVVVPKAFFKVLLCWNVGNWQAIGFVFDNAAGHRKLSTYAKTVDEIEAITNLDFFPLMTDSTQTAIESNFDLNSWLYFETNASK